MYLFAHFWIGVKPPFDKFNKKYSVKDNSTDIYPNPASDYIVVCNYNDASDRTVEIFNLYGQLMKRERSLSTATKIETGDMQNGFYLLKVSDSKRQTH
ncbi:MAG: T9SS type A sorting domain-containing protein [Saprospiraceae bacterium]|nr:T9SS type A sorting domain-containing protein [Saprospiraceae bacterium]